jgi:hypothetical protein
LYQRPRSCIFWTRRSEFLPRRHCQSKFLQQVLSVFDGIENASQSSQVSSGRSKRFG